MSEFNSIQNAYASVIKAGYDGLEIFMMNVGNADCFLIIRYYLGGKKDVILIDGGKKSDAESIVTKIKALGITHIDYVVNTHPHDDHAAGLVEIIKDASLTFGELWMHAPWTRINADAIRLVLGRYSAKWVLEKFEASLATQMDVFNACCRREIPVYEPFAGAAIGPFQVIGPTREFHIACMAKFNDVSSITQWNSYLNNIALRQLIPVFLTEEAQTKEAQTEGELGDITSPENESSVIMTLEYGGQKFLFCGDAGCDAFRDINSRKQIALLQNIHWMHAPHHGSRRNLWPELIEWINPDYVYISCEGTKKHPSRKLVNHFKAKCGAEVYASYYPTSANWAWIRTARGKTPDRNTKCVTALFHAEN